MINKKRVLAISGSTRIQSTNLSLINAISDISSSFFSITIFNQLTNIPHFNPDFDNETVPQSVTDFRNLIKSHDGVLICTPEYAMGVPGSLKNVIDWTVSSADFMNKPTGLITASSVGKNGHAALLETLKIIECRIPDEVQLIISFAKTKISSENKITDEKTFSEVSQLLTNFHKLLITENFN